MKTPRQRPMHVVGKNLEPHAVQRSCFDKYRHMSKNAARDFIARGLKMNPDNPPSHWYHCSVCDGFHVTKLSKEQSTVARRKVYQRL